jgi:uncharacterized protein (DUF1786 family)
MKHFSRNEYFEQDNKRVYITSRNLLLLMSSPQRRRERGEDYLKGRYPMSRFLIVDIGAGTMDILYFDEQSPQHYKAVARSPVLGIAEQAARLPGRLLVTGCEMGGGPLTQVLKARALEEGVIISRSAALTLHHDLEKVQSWGFTVLNDDEADALRQHSAYQHLVIGDLESDRLRQIVEALGVPFEFDVVGLCAQDHGTPPPGVSHLDYRHTIFKQRLDKTPYPHALLYGKDDLPKTFNRLRSLLQSAEGLPTREIFVMDSGMAAILGASMDLQANVKERIIVLDVATSHTVGAALEKGEIAGFFEYHTQDLTPERLDALVMELAEGRLEHHRILKEGGHGAYLRKALGFASVELILATGPKRRLVEKSRLPLAMGAPFGDNMMTGTVGVLEAIRRRKNLSPFGYL